MQQSFWASNQTVFATNLHNGLTSIIPFWASGFIAFYGLGNEYSIIANIVLSHLLKITMTNMNDLQTVILLGISVAVFIAYKSNWLSKVNFFEKKQIILHGFEQTNRSNIYSSKILAINNYLIHEKKIANLIHTSDTNVTIGHLIKYELTSGIYLDVGRFTSENNGFVKVQYIIWSYYNGIDAFLTEIYNKYKNNYTSEMVLIGAEKYDEIDYPVPIHAINYYVSNNCQFPKLKCMKKLQQQEYVGFFGLTTDKDKDKNDTNKQSTKSADRKYIYTLGDIDNFEINGIFLSIYREQTNVYYLLKSDTKNTKEWIEGLIKTYEQKKDDEFKNKVIVQGREIIDYQDADAYKTYYFTDEMWALNWFIIEEKNYQKHRISNGTNAKYECVLEDLDLFELDTDLYLTIKRHQGQKNSNNYETNFDVIYTLFSDNVVIKDALESYVKQFDEFRLKQSPNKILYHFIYNGLEKNALTFTKKILSEKDTPNECYETFDTLFNEHVEPIKNDIIRLKNVDYYKKHGRKRKLGYLFYGKAGCAKTATTIAMALFDERHIIEIPFCNLTKQDEFERILNLTEICGVKIEKEQIIIFFDEIDFGMEQLNPSTGETVKPNAVVEHMQIASALETAISGSTKKNTTTEQKLNIGTLLSKIDGVGNLNGLIIVGATNRKELLHPSLCRNGRMTPKEYKELRKEDAIKLIESHIGKITNAKHLDIIKDRKMVPVDLIALCQLYEYMGIDEFMEKLKEEKVFEK
jgi:hypothetical protein